MSYEYHDVSPRRRPRLPHENRYDLPRTDIDPRQNDYGQQQMVQEYQDVSPRRRPRRPHENRYDVERTDVDPQYYDYNQQMVPDQYRPAPEYRQAYDMYYDGTQRYDDVKPAGRANSYSTRITDLMTSLQDPPEQSPRLSQLIEANKGYLVLMRFRPRDLPDVITAVQESVSTIGSHTGYVIGFASVNDIRIMIANPEMVAKNQWWDPRGQPNYAVCCMWFRDVFACKRWFESSQRIRQPDFPNSYPLQVVAAPVTLGRNQEPLPFDLQEEGITLLWTEFPSIYERYANDFVEHYSEPARKLMKRYGATPYISLCKYAVGWPAEPNKFGQPGYAQPPQQHERMARAIKTGWVDGNTFITVSAFPNMKALEDYHADEYTRSINAVLSRYSHATSVAISLRKVHGTSR